MYKSSITIIFVFLCFSSCQSQNHSSIWTKDYEKERFNEIYEGSKDVFKDDVQRKALTHYTVEKLKLKLPEGVASISADSLQKLLVIIMAEYVENQDTDKFKMNVPWTASGEKTLKESLLNGTYLKKIDFKLRNNYCDCLIRKIKVANPNSMTLPADSVFLKLINQCDVENKGIVHSNKKAGSIH